MDECLKTKIEQLVSGKEIITNDEEMDIIEQTLSDSDSMRLTSEANPNRVGILDQYIAKLSCI